MRFYLIVVTTMFVAACACPLRKCKCIRYYDSETGHYTSKGIGGCEEDGE